MAHLAIHNIGPIKEIDIDLNRFNVFIGPQSSGKSTIAKIVSFCQWLEKDCIMRQQSSHIDKDFVKKNLIDYHNISEYIKDNSTFLYEGKYLHVRFSEGSLQVESTMEFKEARRVSKNAYIPAERTVISVPGIFSTKMPKNYLASFLDDWQQIRTKFENGDKVDILNLGDAYFFDAGANADMLTMKDGKPLHLSQASSGLQSVTPLCVYIAYITAWIYSHSEDKSSDERKRIWDSAVARSMYPEKEFPFNDINDDNFTVAKDLFDGLKQLNDSFQDSSIGGNKFPHIVQMLARIKRLADILATPSFSNIVIEEPELNLFPETQAALVYFILAKIDHNRDNMVITTHSPYILYAINNCILANLVKNQLTEEDWEDFDIPQSARLDGKGISVWELRDGHIINSEGEKNKTIQDKDGLIRGNYFDRVMHNIMADFNNLMNYK